MRSALLPIVVTIFVGSGYRQGPEMTESKPSYTILQPSDVAKVPVILEGLVVADGKPVAPSQKSPLDGRLVQLWKGRVRVENVLQGEIPRQIDSGGTDIFYFIGDIPGSARPIRLRAGDRYIFFLRPDGTNLRTINDRSENGCLLKVMTGPHPNFRKAPDASINEAILDLLLTRGSGINNKQMLEAIDNQDCRRFVGEEQTVHTLQKVARRESPVVREAACLNLLFWKNPCGQEQVTPAVTIRNLSHPNATGTFRVGDRIQTTVAGAAHQTVYRSDRGRLGTTDGNGHFTLTETLERLTEGTRTGVWIVGSDELSPAVSYVNETDRGNVKIVTTAIGNPRDRYGMGLSALSVSGDAVVTYSGTLLDYRTGLYYDAQEADTLYEDGKPIKSGKISGGASARHLWDTKITSWKDYFLQGGHYAVAVLGANTFVNPMKFAEGSCFGTASNCQIVPLDGPTQLAKATIFLGNTGGDQTAVPQNADWALKMLGPEDKASLLDSLLTRGPGADDAYMIAIIGEVGREHEFSNNLLVEKLQEVAERETQAVRNAACSLLRSLKHPCGKRLSRPPAKTEARVLRQRAKPPLQSPVEADRLQTAIPKYMVYAQFLMMIHEMNENKFVTTFRLKSLRRFELDALKGEAAALTRELSVLDLRAQRVTAAFRRTATLALRKGKPLPPEPAAIYRLQAQRTAAIVNHTVNLQAKLGLANVLNLEAMLDYQFASEGNFGHFVHRDQR